MSIQDKMKATLSQCGIPFKQIDCYGSQIVITSECRDTAQRWNGVLSKFCTKFKSIPVIDYAKENKGTALCPTILRVWRTYGTI